MSKYLIQDSTLISIADAIRSKIGESSYIPASIMTDKIASIEILDKSEDIFPYEYGSSTIISFSSNARYILNYAFASCRSLITINFPSCIVIGHNAFYNCAKLTTISFPACIHIKSSAFYSCSSLTTINFPNCISIGENVFQSCYSIQTASFPSCTSIGGSAFRSCSKLTTASFPACTSIAMYAFAYCYNLISLYLTGSSVIRLTSLSIFMSTPIVGYSASAGRYGSVYVPSSLLTAYKTAINWSTISERIVGI